MKKSEKLKKNFIELGQFSIRLLQWAMLIACILLLLAVFLYIV